MDAYSISFTLGKASNPHGANLRHNNRKFLAPNIDPSRTEQNVTYVRQDVREAYHQLFDQAVQEYNARQYRKDRVINDYYEQIASGKREEAFYEASDAQSDDSVLCDVSAVCTGQYHSHVCRHKIFCR